jgi:transcriptional regulator with XRE-family HTH domain
MRGWLKEARKRKGLTQQEVSEGANISRSYYAEIENGTKTPSGKIAIKISKFLGIKSEKFFE